MLECCFRTGWGVCFLLELEELRHSIAFTGDFLASTSFFVDVEEA